MFRIDGCVLLLPIPNPANKASETHSSPFALGSPSLICPKIPPTSTFRSAPSPLDAETFCMRTDRDKQPKPVVALRAMRFTVLGADNGALHADVGTIRMKGCELSTARGHKRCGPTCTKVGASAG